MDIPMEQADKISRYFINADPFLWGVLKAKNKKGRLKELQGMGLLGGYSAGSNPIYTRINRDLMVELGITGILETIVIPRVQEGFGQATLRYFRDCWQQGQTPELDYLAKNKLYNKGFIGFRNVPEIRDTWSNVPPVVGYKDAAYVFVQIDAQHNFVERWTTFAGLWFEEIEPLLR